MAEENEPQQEIEPQEQAEEPSMDEILGSIREILSDDGKSAEGQDAPNTDQASDSMPEQGSDEELATRENGNEEPEPEPGPNDVAKVMQEPNVEIEAVSGEPGFEEDVDEILELTQQMIAPSPSDVDAGVPILSGSTQTASTDPLQELAKALLNRRDIAIGSRDMTLEGLIREILRPLLKEWLDENLPYLIERLVKKEIDHMVNRAERLDL